MTKAKENKDILVTEVLLNKLNACIDGKEWWLKTYGESKKVKDLKYLPEDNHKYLSWLKQKMYNSTFDKNLNQLTQTYSYGYSWTRTYNKAGYEVTRTNSNGYSWTSTYDKDGNELSFSDTNGDSWERTYDKEGNCLTFSNTSEEK